MTFILAAVTVAATLITLARIMDIRKLLGFAVIIDVVFSILMFFIFAGTLGGTLVAVVSGLFMALTLTVARRLIGYDKLSWRGFVRNEGMFA